MCLPPLLTVTFGLWWYNHSFILIFISFVTSLIFLWLAIYQIVFDVMSMSFSSSWLLELQKIHIMYLVSLLNKEWKRMVRLSSNFGYNNKWFHLNMTSWQLDVTCTLASITWFIEPIVFLLRCSWWCMRSFVDVLHAYNHFYFILILRLLVLQMYSLDPLKVFLLLWFDIYFYLRMFFEEIQYRYK